MSIAQLLTLLATTASLLCGLQCTSAEEKEDLYSREYSRGICKLAYAIDPQNESYNNSQRVWFGSQVTLKTEFYLYDTVNSDRIWINVGGTALNTNANTTYYFNNHVAFFDDNDNLIACGSTPGLLPVESLERRRFSLNMPIPRGYQEVISKYKSAYYESEVQVRKIKGSKSIAASELPLRSEQAQFRINPKGRLLPEGKTVDSPCYTIEGECNLPAVLSRKPRHAIPEESAKQWIGDKSSSQASFYFSWVRDDGLAVHYFLKNNSDSVKYHDFHVAFFDERGVLVGCAFSQDLKCDARSTTPSFSAKGNLPLTNTQIYFGLYYPLGVPIIEHTKIAYYKMSMYIYEQPAIVRK